MHSHPIILYVCPDDTGFTLGQHVLSNYDVAVSEQPSTPLGVRGGGDAIVEVPLDGSAMVDAVTNPTSLPQQLQQPAVATDNSTAVAAAQCELKKYPGVPITPTPLRLRFFALEHDEGSYWRNKEIFDEDVVFHSLDGVKAYRQNNKRTCLGLLATAPKKVASKKARIGDSGHSGFNRWYGNTELVIHN
jgi:hypothetical protein